MMIREPEPDRAGPRTLKVRLPTELHVQLHSLKILTGKSISDAVEEALLGYFESTARAGGVRAAAAGRGVSASS